MYGLSGLDPMSDEYNTPYNVVRYKMDDITECLVGEDRSASVYGAPVSVASEEVLFRAI